MHSKCSGWCPSTTAKSLVASLFTLGSTATGMTRYTNCGRSDSLVTQQHCRQGASRHSAQPDTMPTVQLKASPDRLLLPEGEPSGTDATGMRRARPARMTLARTGSNDLQLDRRARLILGDHLPRWRDANAARRLTLPGLGGIQYGASSPSQIGEYGLWRAQNIKSVQFVNTLSLR
jgi:hypothetical protein